MRSGYFKSYSQKMPPPPLKPRTREQMNWADGLNAASQQETKRRETEKIENAAEFTGPLFGPI